MGVRQVLATEQFAHNSASGRKLHKLGSSMMPSKTPSSRSHWFKTSSWMRPHFSAVMKSGEVFGPVMVKKLALHETRLLKSTAGEPATMPSKSLGNISAAFMHWRSPREQPR